MKKFAIILCILCLICFSSFTFINKENIPIEEKIGQLLIIGYLNDARYNSILENAENNSISGVIIYKKNILSKEDIKQKIEKINEKSKNKLPLFFMLDQEGGLVSRINKNNGFKYYPSAEEISKLEEEKAYKIYDEMAKDLKSVGFNFNLAPCVDIKTNENSEVGKKHRTYGNNNIAVSKYAKIFIKAHQNNNIITTLKHFPGIGNTALDSHKTLPDITNSWKEEELLPYKNILEEYPDEAVMIAHILNKKLDEENISSLSKKTISILKEQYNHEGLVVMDAADMDALDELPMEKIIIQAINAGIDLFIFPNQTWEENNSEEFMTPTIFKNIVLKAIENGEITEKQIDRRYKKIATIKNKILLNKNK